MAHGESNEMQYEGLAVVCSLWVLFSRLELDFLYCVLWPRYLFSSFTMILMRIIQLFKNYLRVLSFTLETAVPLPQPMWLLVIWTVRYSLSTSGHVPRTRHVWNRPSNVRTWGSPNTTHTLDRRTSAGSTNWQLLALTDSDSTAEWCRTEFVVSCSKTGQTITSETFV